MTKPARSWDPNTDNEVVQVLRAELLRPVSMHLRGGRSFIVRPTDVILGARAGFIVSRSRLQRPSPVYVEEIEAANVVAFDLKLKWRLRVDREKLRTGKLEQRTRKLRRLLGQRAYAVWLRTPNPNLGGDIPEAWLAKGRIRAIDDLIDDMLTGATT